MEGQDDNGGMWNSADWHEYEAAQELNEGRNDEPSNTHYAIHKPTGKIVFSWDYTGYDPEVGGGVDYGNYPQSRTFMLGVNINF